MITTAAIRRRLGSTLPSTPTVWTLTPGLWLGFALLFATYVVGDAITTNLAAQYSGGWEGNPFAAFTLQGGLIGLIIFKLFALLAIYGITRLTIIDGSVGVLKAIKIALFVGSALFLVVGASNLMAAFTGYDLYHYFFR